MKTTKEFLKEKHACSGGYGWFLECGETEHETIIHKLMEEDHYDWASWLITRMLDPIGDIQYAIFAAEIALPIYERTYPNDNRPRIAIEAARNYLINPTRAAADAARAAADAARAAARAARAETYTKIIKYGLKLLGDAK